MKKKNCRSSDVLSYDIIDDSIEIKVTTNDLLSHNTLLSRLGKKILSL